MDHTSDRPGHTAGKTIQLIAVGMAERNGHGQRVGGVIGLGHSRQAQRMRVISCTCFFTALPYPVTACLTCMGVYS